MADYIIIGDDGKEYGPVTEVELRSWIAEKRAGTQTKVRASDSADWRMLAEVPEFRDALNRPAPPPPPVGALSKKPASTKTSALAIGSLVLGIMGLFTCGSTALFGLALGIIALVKISRSRGGMSGQGMALAGVIVSGICLVFVPITAAMLLPALAAAKQKAMQINCLNNEKQLALAVKIYSSDHANHLPPAATWCDAIHTAVGSDRVFKCPSANGSNRCDYAFNAKLDSLDENGINPQTVVIFESDSGWNAHGGPELMASGRHRRISSVVAFADGHVEIVAASRLNSLRWDP